MKSFIIACNWKMNKTPQESLQFIKKFKNDFLPLSGRDILFFPPFLSLSVFQQELVDTSIEFGAQNCHSELSGAYTGEVSVPMLQSLGAKYCLVGHSERRTLFAETDTLVAKKIKVLQSVGMIPVVCVGETEQQRLQGKTLDTIRSQLELGLAGHTIGQKIILAYEPVWAIGTGKVATTSDVQEVHHFIRHWTDENFSQEVPLLYGGSVSAKNSKELEAVPHVNGFLIGGASLQVESLMPIYVGKL